MVARARRLWLIVLLGTALPPTCGSPGQAAHVDRERGSAGGQLLLRFSARLPEEGRANLLSALGLGRVARIGALDIEVVGPAADWSEAAARLAEAPGVSWVEPNEVCQVALAAPNDPAYAEPLGDLYVQWPAHALEAASAWERYPGWYFEAVDRPQDSPIVALIDTGVDAGHPDFRNPGSASAEVAEGGQVMVSLAGAFAGAGGLWDEHGHGTHLAGLIAAGADNGATGGSGIAGIGYPLRLLPLKAAGANGVATHADVARAVVYAADEGAAVIAIGFSGPTWSRTLQEAVDYAWERGCFVVAPAGDAGGSGPSFPAACPHVFGVGAVAASGLLAEYSGAGEYVAMVAPGGDQSFGVYSTLPTYACTLRGDLSGPAYGWAHGTSQAAAHVAAGAGLYAGAAGLGREGGDEGVAIWQALERSAVPRGEAGWTAEWGYGMLALPGLVEDGGAEASGPGSIVGRVLVEGDPAVGAAVRARPEEGGVELTAATAWPAGRYRIANISPGRYGVVAEVEGLRGEWTAVEVLSGCDAPGVDFRLGDPPAGAVVARAEIPGAAVRGQGMWASVCFRNTGESTWRRGEGYRVDQVAREAAFCATVDHVDLAPGEAVAPGQERSFTVWLPAPEECGFYEVGWQMCQQGGWGRFGEMAGGRVSVTSFLDVPADHWAVREIEVVKEAGVVQGYGGYLYRPGWVVSRDQMAVYLARALAGGEDNIPEGTGEATFPDVDEDHWAYRCVEYVRLCGVVDGYPDGLYHPEYVVDRGQMAAFMARALAAGNTGPAEYTPPEEATFGDVPVEAWNYGAVEYLVARGVVGGYPDGCYHPEYACSRDQMAVFVARAFGL